MNGLEAASVLKTRMPRPPIVPFTILDEGLGQSLIASQMPN